jgi:hypothetical protein
VLLIYSTTFYGVIFYFGKGLSNFYSSSCSSFFIDLKVLGFSIFGERFLELDYFDFFVFLPYSDSSDSSIIGFLLALLALDLLFNSGYGSCTLSVLAYS